MCTLSREISKIGFHLNDVATLVSSSVDTFLENKPSCHEHFRLVEANTACASAVTIVFILFLQTVYARTQSVGAHAEPIYTFYCLHIRSKVPLYVERSSLWYL